jgi:hypothetical protein
MTKPFNPSLIVKHLRQLLQQKIISPHDYAVADALLWRCRAPGREDAQISYDRLAKLAGVGRTKAVAAVGKLRRLGLLLWEKSRLRVAWSLGFASRQWRNIYRWLAPSTEVAARPTNQEQVKKKDCLQKETCGLPRPQWGRPVPHPPIRTVAEQLAILSAADPGCALLAITRLEAANRR